MAEPECSATFLAPFDRPLSSAQYAIGASKCGCRSKPSDSNSASESPAEREEPPFGNLSLRPCARLAEVDTDITLVHSLPSRLP